MADRLVPIAALALALLTASAAAQQAMSPDEIRELWAASPHADASDPAFTHWDEEGVIPEDCATCHSGTGLIDYLGGDGSAFKQVDQPHPAGTVIDCAACHTPENQPLDSVTFPSGVEVSGLGSSAICTVCHQGRQSTDDVRDAVGEADPDTVSDQLAFLNIHYRAAGATLLGSQVRGGYQYEGRDYAGPFVHIPEALAAQMGGEQFNTCTGCHDAHSLEPVPVAACASCHTGVTDYAQIRARPTDFDGDGDTGEGIHGEIATMHARLGEAIGLYAAEVAGAPIVYADDAYPYFFADTDADGELDAAEAAFPNRYQSWTPRLLKGAYNYQFVAKDPGGYAHNPTYLMQLLHDSIADLAEATGTAPDGLTRP